MVAMFKLLVLCCLVALTFGASIKSPSKNVKESEKPSVESPLEELQSHKYGSSGEQPEKGDLRATNQGEWATYKEWDTTEFKVGQKQPTRKEVKKPLAEENPASKFDQLMADKTVYEEENSSNKPNPLSQKSTKQLPKKTLAKTTIKSKKPAPKGDQTKIIEDDEQSKFSEDGKPIELEGVMSSAPSPLKSPENESSVESKQSTTALWHETPPKKRGLLADHGSGVDTSGEDGDEGNGNPEGKQNGKKGGKGKKSEEKGEKSEEIVPTMHEEYSDLINPIPSPSFAENYFINAAKPIPKSPGCEDSYNGELPKIIIPHHYDLAFKFDVKSMKFWGHELIYVDVNVPKLEYFFLHSHELEIAEILYIDSQKQKPIIGNISNVDAKEKQLTITLDTPQETKNGFISVKWKGIVSDTLDGIYKTTAINVEDPDNPVDYEAVSTQFEPASARKAFPCIDEPAVKATYNQTLITQVENVALANGMEKDEEILPEDKDGVKWKKATFERTPKMSTFLLAFFAGEFEMIEGKSVNNGIRVRVYMAKGRKDDAEYALKEAIQSLDFLERHFAIDFPMPKIDMVAVPDYAQGAMENWGLITFRESILLIRKSEMLKPKMEACAMIITHELVHQWFGNLVTHRWWKYLWLKEGFAQFMQHFITDKVHPEWKVLNTFATVDYINAMSGDASVDSHAIQVQVDSVGDVGEIFDDVSYAKGASLLRWLMDWLGEETMKKGYTKYLSDNKFATACTPDLWSALESVSGKPVGKVMEAWVTMKGFPMVSVMILHKNSSALTLKMIQRRFSLTPSGIDDKDDLWSFPVKFITSREDEDSSTDKDVAKSEFMFDKKSYIVTIPMEGFSTLDWIKINPGAVGFYNVKYLEPLSFRLIDPIMEQTLGYIDRLSLIDDLFQQVSAGEKSPIEYLNFVKAYRDDPNYYVWQSIDRHVSKLTLIASNTHFGDSFKVFCHYLYGSIFEKIPSWDPIEGEGSDESGLKAMIIKRLGFSDYKEVVAKARQYYNDEMSGTKKIPKTLKQIVYAIVTRQMNDTEIKDRIRKYVETDDEAEKRRIQFSFPHVQDQSQIETVIKLCFSNHMRSMDSLTILSGLASTSLEARTLVWRFFVQNAAEFKKRYDGSNNLAKFLKGLLSGFASKSVLDKMKKNLEEIVQEYSIEGVNMAIKQGYDFGISNYNILLRGGQEIATFLSEFAQFYTN